MKTIAVVGFGFCGRLAFFHWAKNLAKEPNKKTKILIFDKIGKESLGTAFSSFSPFYVLNVPTKKMSAFSDFPQDFCQFLQKNYPQIWEKTGENGFVPREIYGEYIDQFTRQAFDLARDKNADFEFVYEEVVEIFNQKTDEFLLKTQNQKTFQANQILLATSFNQVNLAVDFSATNLIQNLWKSGDKKFHQQIFSNNQTICLIGCGLSAVDVIVGLKNKNFSGKIFAISRRGNFCKKHFTQIQKNFDFISPQDAKKGVLFLALKIRNFLRQNPQFDLRHVVDSVRLKSVEIWQNFDQKNKKLFLRFLPYWNIFRHRAPASSIEIIEKMIESGQIEVRKKGIKKIEQKGEKILVKTASEEIECDYLVNCLGFEFNPKKYPLFNQMLAQNLLKNDLFLVKSNHPKIYLLGGLNIGRDFECTSVPDLRVSVENFFQNHSQNH
jgi:uncharacterized NAD(P)/FAD-binding protein YdhS